MSHERSETVQDPKTGKWINVYGRGTKQAGQRLPADATGYGHREYDTEPEASGEAAKRSDAYLSPSKAAPNFRDGGYVRGYVSAANGGKVGSCQLNGQNMLRGRRR